MRKLVVFDLDKTLIDSRESPTDCPGSMITFSEECTMHVYVRPFTVVTLRVCRGDPEMSVVLFSAGDSVYVYTILDTVLLPIMGDDFYFDAIFTRENLDDHGVKRMDVLRHVMQADSVLLVDDSLFQCMHGGGAHDAHWINIPPYDAAARDAGMDCELARILEHPFFYWTIKP